ncbi:MAG TPA: tetratricopeptide repeat protein, partial [Acidobacteriaceae bacterium]
AYYNLGAALLKLRRYDQSADAFRRSAQIAPQDYSGWSGLGDAEYYGGRRPQAMNDYRKGIELATAQLKTSPNDAGVLADVAGMDSMIGDAPKAIDLMNRALTINHTDPNLMFGAAELYNQLQQTGPALEWLGKALQAGYPRSVVASAAALDNLHSNPRYQQLMQSTQQKP